MAQVPDDVRYSEDHEWARDEAEFITVGITDHAQQQLGDVVYVELPAVGDQIARGEPFGTVESTKAVSELFAPIGGTILEVNEGLSDSPEWVNEDPYDTGWMVKITPSNKGEWDELLSPEDYAAHAAKDA